MTEDYVSFETAKLLKEKGFDWECKTRKFYPEPEYDVESPNGVYAPTLQMAMKWLREVHDAIVNVFYDKDEEKWCAEHYRMLIGDYTLIGYYRTYEEACEAAIKYCLENLI